MVYSLNFVLNFCIRSNSTDTEYYCSTVKGGKGHQSKRILSPVGVDDWHLMVKLWYNALWKILGPPNTCSTILVNTCSGVYSEEHWSKNTTNRWSSSTSSFTWSTGWEPIDKPIIFLNSLISKMIQTSVKPSFVFCLHRWPRVNKPVLIY